MKPLQEVRLAFAVKHYHWAQARFAQEVRGGFPLLRQFEKAGAKVFLETIGEMAPNDQTLFAQALLRRYHVDAVTCLNETSCREEQLLIERYIERINESMWQNNESQPFPLSNPIPRRQLRKLLADRVGDRFGKQIKSDLPGSICAERRTENIVVHTFFYTAGQIDSLRYWHDVRNENGDRIAELLSVLASFGISGMTSWESVSECQINQVLGALDVACQNFLMSVQEMASEPK